MVLRRSLLAAGQRAWHGAVRAASTAAPLPAGVDAWPCHARPIAEATTLPASWYTAPAALAAERGRVFGGSWQLAGHAAQVSAPGGFLTGALAPWRYVVVRGEDGRLRAFHNVCRHHAAAVAHGCGTAERFVCGYHGWEYGTDGRLAKAPRVRGIKGFKARDFGLRPIALDTWGPFVFLWLGGSGGDSGGGGEGPAAPVPLREWLGTGAGRMAELGVADPMVHVAKRSYDLWCNWKVFCDNYLDGGYHVSVAHPGLAAQLDLGAYRNELHGRVSVQTCAPDAGAGARVGGAAARPAGYFFLHPNAMINRYGPWMDSNVVKPTGVDRCRVEFDWWLEAGVLEGLLAEAAAGGRGQAAEGQQQANGQPQQQQHAEGQQQQQQQQQQGAVRDGCGSGGSRGAGDGGAAAFEGGTGPLVFTHPGAAALPFVVDSLARSHQVQLEDVALCETVQQGLEEPAYGSGRYAPELEGPMFKFHRLVHDAIAGGGSGSAPEAPR